MSELINTNVFVPTAEGAFKFVDFKGLDYFWEKAKAYVDAADKATADRVDALEGVVGNADSGLVKDVKAIQDELAALSNGEGSITTQINNAIAALDVDDAAVEGQYVSSVKEVDGKIEVTRAALPVYEEVGSAAQALADAKAYVDGIVGDTTGEDGTVTTKGLNSRIADLEAIDHEKLASDASAAAVATILDGAPEKFDTLKEVAQWIADSESAADAADLVTRVSALETEVGDPKSTNENGDEVAATGLYKLIEESDAAALQAAKDYTDSLANGAVKTNTEAINTINTVTVPALQDAISKAEENANNSTAEALKGYYTKEEANAAFDANGAAATAKSEAIADADAKLANKANSADVYTKTEVDGLLTSNSSADQAYAKKYTDELFASMTFVTTDDIDGMFPTVEA